MRRSSKGRAGHEPANPALVAAFGSACSSADHGRLADLLSDDVQVVVDSGGELGGTASAARGPADAARAIGTALGAPLELALHSINGSTGLVGRRNGDVVAVILLDGHDGRVDTVWIVLAADKLAHWNRSG